MENLFIKKTGFWEKGTDGEKEATIISRSKSPHPEVSQAMIWGTGSDQNLGKQCSKVQDQLIQWVLNIGAPQYPS